MGYWKRHPKPEGQKTLEVFDERGWRILDPPTYYTVRCPCGEHQRQVHISPSNPGYWSECLKWARRTCPTWEAADVVKGRP